MIAMLMKKLIGASTFAAVALTPLISHAQDPDRFIEVNVSLSLANMVRSVDAVVVECSASSTLHSRIDSIGYGATVFDFGGERETTSDFDPNTEDATRFTDLVVVDRDSIPSNATVKIYSIGEMPLDAWTNGRCHIGVMSTQQFSPNTVSFNLYHPQSYSNIVDCDDIRPNELIACAAPGTSDDSFVLFVRPGFEVE